MAIILFFLLFQGFAAAGEKAVFDPLVTIERLKSIPKNDLVILDSRSSWKYLLSHIPGAIHTGGWKDFSTKKNGVPGLLNTNKDFIAKKLNSMGIDYSKTIVIYGSPTDKWRTDGRFFWMFEYYGFKRVGILEGGLPLWKKNSLPVERGSAKEVTSANLKPNDIKLNLNVSAEQDWIRERLGSPALAIIDNRTLEEYAGETPYGSSRGGHIPGAVHIDWREFFSDEGYLKKSDLLLNILNKYSLGKDKEIVVYCTGGVRSAMAYFVLRKLNFKVRNYDGSWWDWSRNPSLPVES